MPAGSELDVHVNTIIIGAGGHSRVVYDILQYDHNADIVAFIDNAPRGSEETIMCGPVAGDHDVVPDLIKKRGVGGFIVAVGDNEIRKRHYEKFRDMGLEPISAIHPNAHISETADIGQGSVVCAGAALSTNAEIGRNAIINTGSIIEHETTLADHTHVGPGTTLAGRVTVGRETFIGMGCSVKEYTSIGKKATVGAGSVVLEDVNADTTVVGTPAEVTNDDGA